MSLSISRRDFIKKTSVAAAGVGVTSISTLAKPFEQNQKVRVVIAKDTGCMSGSTVNKTVVQNMIDFSVKALTGITDKGKAYEALFPKAITSSTKIILKRNDVSGAGAVNKAVVECLRDGLKNMLGGAFPVANITIYCNGNNMKTTLASNDYVFNCPVAWCHGTDYGVTLSCKNTMNYINNPSSDLHGANKSWLYNVSLNALVKPKQVMSMMDALVGNHKTGPGTSSAFLAHTIIMSKDLIAVDYNTLRLMEKQTGASTSRIASGDSQLKAATTLGTCDPAQMEIITLGPPWNDPTPVSQIPVLTHENIHVDTSIGSQVTFSFPLVVGQRSELSIFDVSGKMVWKHQLLGNRYVWEGETLRGGKVSAGTYVYSLKIGSQSFNNKVTIR